MRMMNVWASIATMIAMMTGTMMSSRRRAIRMQALNGEWLHEMGGAMSGQSVNRSGSFSGSGVFLGRNLDDHSWFDLGRQRHLHAQRAPRCWTIAVNGRFVWDRGCHLDYQTFDPTGSYIMDQGRLHM